MMIRIDQDSAVPPFEQLRSQIAAMIAAEQLPEGHRLPPIRQLAVDLDLAPGTIARAYRELEAAGLVVTEGRRGTRVAAAAGPDAQVVDEELKAAVTSFVTTAYQLGVDPQRALTAISHALGRPLPG